MREKILSAEDQLRMLDWLDEVEKGFSIFFGNYEKVTNEISNSDIIHSFYESGSRGQKSELQMTKLCEALKEYKENISNQLIPQTKRYLERQIDNLIFEGADNTYGWDRVNNIRRIYNTIQKGEYESLMPGNNFSSSDFDN